MVTVKLHRSLIRSYLKG